MTSGQKQVPESSRISILHQRYVQQAGWTSAIREHLFTQSKLSDHPRILEVGCGTGAILEEISRKVTPTKCFGVDIDFEALSYGINRYHTLDITCSNAAMLPFPDNSFDLIYCHFFLLWAKPLQGILAEMVRVLSPGASLIAFAEPDYGGRIDFPPELKQLGDWQEQALQRQGAHTRIGRELAQQFIEHGLSNISTGVLGGEWEATPMPGEETTTLLQDLQENTSIDQNSLHELLSTDQEAREKGTRILFVPTFYAIGTKKSSLANSSNQLYNSGR